MTTRSPLKRLAFLGALGALAASSLPATAAAAPTPRPVGTVFVQTDGLTGNEIVVYTRESDGTLTKVGSYPTEGLGGQLSGSVVDHTASQGSLAYDRWGNLLLAVNAGSNTISVFSIQGEQLSLRQVLGSGGKFPVSITTHANQVYVLDAEEGAALQGYVVREGYLSPVASEHRALGLATGKKGEETQFTHTPGQVAFTPSGTDLIVTTKQAGESIEVFPVGSSPARLAPTPVVTAAAGNPFDLAFLGDELLVTEAGPNALASFRLQPSGELTKLDEVATGQSATCWIATAGSHFYTSNAGSASVTAFSPRLYGGLSDLGNTPTHPGTVDAASAGGDLYVQGGKEGTVDEFQVLANGSLSNVGSVTVPGALGAEGIVAL